MNRAKKHYDSIKTGYGSLLMTTEQYPGEDLEKDIKRSLKSIQHKTIKDAKEAFIKWATKKNKDDNGSMIYINHITEFTDELEKQKINELN